MPQVEAAALASWFRQAASVLLISEDLLHRFPELAAAAATVRHHHEWFDGTGYPDRLAGAAIPIGARIVAVTDAYTAMISDRPHSTKRTPIQACDELLRCAGTQFDPTVVKAFLSELRQVTPTRVIAS
jgi:HD-GYP domain-containing protein (c-di-GMP phosphodiesterase class II)